MVGGSVLASASCSEQRALAGWAASRAHLRFALQAEGEGAHLPGVIPGQAVPAAARDCCRTPRALWRDAGRRAHPGR